MGELRTTLAEKEARVVELEEQMAADVNLLRVKGKELTHVKTLLEKIEIICDIGSAEEFGDGQERLKGIKQLLHDINEELKNDDDTTGTNTLEADDD